MATYNLDPTHATAAFSIKHLMISKVRGSFQKLSGQLTYDAKNPAGSSIEVAIEAASINTSEPQRDAHLKSADFFDVEKFPVITFKSKQFQKSDDGFKVVGDLTIHGVTKQVTLEMEEPTDELKDPWGNIKMGVSGTTKIKRKDFGLTWNAALETGGVVVGDEVSITLDVEFAKAA